MTERQKRQAWSPETEREYTERRIERARAGSRPALRAFAHWLETERGLGLGSITVRVGSASTFVDAVTCRAKASCVEALGSLHCADVEAFFVEYGREHGLASRRSMRSAMRSFLEFVASQGWVDRKLEEAVPSLRSHRLAGLPRGLSNEQISTILGTSWGQRPCSLRDRAIVYLLATYGARRGQISALQLEDIDWHERRIRFVAHKGGKPVEHALTAAAAQALADYLCHERPASQSLHLFLRQVLPHQQLNPDAITALVWARMKRCGLAPRGAHALRHAFATRLLRAGQSMKAIADLLGHRSLDTVAIYAKVDHARLLECAAEWPEASR